MVRYIERNQAFLPSSELYLRPGGRPSPTCSPTIELYWCKMVMKKNIEVVTELSTIQLAPGEGLDDRGYWLDTSYYFVQSAPAIPLSFYF